MFLVLSIAFLLIMITHGQGGRGGQMGRVVPGMALYFNCFYEDLNLS